MKFIARPKSIIRSALIFFYLFLSSSLSFSSEPLRLKAPRYKSEIYPDRLVVKFKQAPEAAALNKMSSDLSQILNQSGIEFKPFYQGSDSGGKLSKSAFRPELRKIYYCYLEKNVSYNLVRKRLAKDPAIEYVEPVFKHRINAMPNDNLLVSQNAFLDLIEAKSAWDIVKGDFGNVVVAVIDGGTDIRHPDLAANLWVNPDEIPNNKIDDDNNGFVDDIHGWNFATNTGDASGLPSQPTSANHGTKTAGIVCAVTDNGIGVAGLSWNAKLMAINAVDPIEEDGIIRDGYAGIIYAVENGADVINLSWGRDEPASLFEQEIINYAAEHGVAIVSSAGNDSDDFLNYPASYPYVLSVANTSLLDRKVGSSNYGRTVDLSAPGEQIFSILNGGNYGVGVRLSSGTSFSSPLAAGAVALVKTLKPDWLGVQAAEQVRVNTENIDDLNPSFAGLLGLGRLNVNNAVRNFESPAIRIHDVTVIDSDQNNIISPGERVKLYVDFINYLAPVSSALVTLNSDNPDVTIVEGMSLITNLNTLAITASPLQFEIEAPPDAQAGSTIDLNFEISIGSYQDVDRFSVKVAAQHADLAINNIQTTVTGIGRIGFADVVNQTQGNGFFHSSKISDNLLYEAAIIAGASEARISNSARVFFNNNVYDQDFAVPEDERITVSAPGRLSDQESMVRFDDRLSNTPVGIQIIQETFAGNMENARDFIVFKFTVQNQNPDSLQNFHFGFFFDWDVIDYQANSAAFLPSHKLAYAFKDSTFVGSAILNNGPVNCSLFDNFGAVLANGFTDAEKWQAISSGADSLLSNRDVAYVMSTGPFNMSPGESVVIGFALVAGTSAAGLQTTVEAAQDWWDTNIVTSVNFPDAPSAGLPEQFVLGQNYPNPFNPTTQIVCQLKQREHARLEIYNLLGQKIRTLVDEIKSAGVFSAEWDGRDEQGFSVGSGIYVYRLQTTSGFVASKKMLLLK